MPGQPALRRGGSLLREQLMNALVGDTEDRSGVAHADPTAGESDGCFASLLDCQAVGVAGLFPGLSGLFDGPVRGFWQHRSGDELDRGFVGLVPQGGCFAYPVERLVDGLAPGMHPWFFLELDRPAPVVLLFEPGGVGLHGFLPHFGGIAGHWMSHLRPRHGSRSRSIDLSVPGVRSPAWTGTTVWQLPHRQIWWDPRWRTELQPR